MSSPERPILIRRAEQLLLATLIACSLVAMIAAWMVQQRRHQGLIEIETAEPIEIQYAVDVNAATWVAGTSWNFQRIG